MSVSRGQYAPKAVRAGLYFIGGAFMFAWVVIVPPLFVLAVVAHETGRRLPESIAEVLEWVMLGVVVVGGWWFARRALRRYDGRGDQLSSVGDG